jgi:hypothetical protein
MSRNGERLTAQKGAHLIYPARLPSGMISGHIGLKGAPA